METVVPTSQSPARHGHPPPRTRSLATLACWLLLLGAIATGFATLGLWQLERLQWKRALITRVDARTSAPVVAPPSAAAWPQVSAEHDAYRHVRMHGRFLSGKDTQVQAVTRLGSGWWIMTPFLRDNGEIVLVNRGWIPATASPVAAATLPSTVTGLLRISEPHGGFLRGNDAANGHWYSRDVQAIARAHGVTPVAPYFIDAAATDDTPANPAANPGIPVGGLTVIQFRNHHLQYALTWFGLTLMTLWAGWVLLRMHRNLRHHADSPSQSERPDARPTPPND